MNKPKIIFYGGIGSTTGANIMLEFNQKKILVDCGLFQAMGAEEKNFSPFKYNPAEVDFLIITHAHMDHIGRVPKLVKDGFRGRIISTRATLDLARPMLSDALRVFQARHRNRVIFDEKDLEQSFTLWEGKDYKEKIELFLDCTLEMQDAGHILGSAICNITCGQGVEAKKVAFTGDLGNSPSPLLPDTNFPNDADYLVMESVYGDRNHESKTTRRSKLKQAILNGIKKNGAIIIPTFSIERAQVLLYEINNMVEDKEIPSIPVFLDSPLAEKVTDIYKKYTKDFKETVRQEIKAGDDIFNFPGLKFIKTRSESAEIEKIVGPKIILAGSGMSEGGRVVNHEITYLPDPKATIVLVGYQPVGTLGRKLRDGIKEVIPPLTPFQKGGEGRGNHNFPHAPQKIKIQATIENITGYSSHKDSEHLLEFVEKTNESKKLSKVFVVMGEPKSSLFLAQRIREYLDIPAFYPEEGRVYELI